MACCLVAPNHYLSQCWLLLSEFLWHSCDSYFTASAAGTILFNEFKYLSGVSELTIQSSCQSHYNDVIMSAVTSQITSIFIVCSAVPSGADQRNFQSSVSLVIVQGIDRWLVNSPRKRPVTWKMCPFDEVIIWLHNCIQQDKIGAVCLISITQLLLGSQQPWVQTSMIKQSARILLLSDLCIDKAGWKTQCPIQLIKLGLQPSLLQLQKQVW